MELVVQKEFKVTHKAGQSSLLETTKEFIKAFRKIQTFSKGAKKNVTNYVKYLEGELFYTAHKKAKYNADINITELCSYLGISTDTFGSAIAYYIADVTDNPVLCDVPHSVIEVLIGKEEEELVEEYNKVLEAKGKVTQRTAKAYYKELGGKPAIAAAKKEEEEPEDIKVFSVTANSLFKEKAPKAPTNLTPVVDATLNTITNEAWKEFHKKVVKIVHPDKGGDEGLARTLQTIHDAMKNIIRHHDHDEAVKEWSARRKAFVTTIPEDEIENGKVTKEYAEKMKEHFND